jgi:hypothetical protein
MRSIKQMFKRNIQSRFGAVFRHRRQERTCRLRENWALRSFAWRYNPDHGREAETKLAFRPRKINGSIGTLILAGSLDASWRPVCTNGRFISAQYSEVPRRCDGKVAQAFVGALVALWDRSARSSGLMISVLDGQGMGYHVCKHRGVEVQSELHPKRVCASDKFCVVM